jgi:hypothetical protein
MTDDHTHRGDDVHSVDLAASERCGTCKFYRDIDQHRNGLRSGYGVCRRYPGIIKTNDGGWCGEFVAAPTEGE